jgi:hypothetical protein
MLKGIFFGLLLSGSYLIAQSVVAVMIQMRAPVFNL